MSNYIYTLHDYHAIKSAEIALNGITVLAGENGCGKSTLSRWLYYIVNGVANYERNLIKNFITETQFIINRWEIVTRDITRANPQLNQFSFISHAQEQLLQLVLHGGIEKDSINRTKQIFQHTLEAFSEQLLLFLKTNIPSVRKERVINFLSIKIDEIDSETLVISQFKEVHRKLIEKKVNDLYTRLQDRKIEDFNKIVKKEYEEEDSLPSGLQLSEDGVDIFDHPHLSSIYNLNQAIYIDTPMALTTGSGNVFWRELYNIMFAPSINEYTTETAKLIHRIKKIIGGEVKLIDDDVFTDVQELRYISEDGLIDIELSKAATGFKTFTYVQRLLQSGLLNKNTLLLIDEPEAHLHPQWIVEYARLLVLINKNIGSKIMIASHNPDMVAAIRAISEKENILDSVNFYLAESNGEHKYSYKDLHGEIGEIFSSFNIALDRIKMYGADSI